MAYIALFDILGFKELIRTTPMSELLDLLGDRWGVEIEASTVFVHDTRPERDPNVPVHDYFKARAAVASVKLPFLRFSDTILIYSTEESDDSLARLVLAGNRLLAFGVLQGLLLRGAITKGELHVSEDRTLYLGEGLIRAYELEQAQNWSGAIIDEERIHVPDVMDENRYVFGVWDMLVQERAIKQYRVPLKSLNTQRNQWCLAWPSCLSKVPPSELEDFVRRRVHPDDGPSQVKVANTLEFARSYREWLLEPLNFIGVPGARFRVRRD